jgi:hypothetical protein
MAVVGMTIVGMTIVRMTIVGMTIMAAAIHGRGHGRQARIRQLLESWRFIALLQGLENSHANASLAA